MSWFLLAIVPLNSRPYHAMVRTTEWIILSMGVVCRPELVGYVSARRLLNV